jgi:hypothetical protein
VFDIGKQVILIEVLKCIIDVFESVGPNRHARKFNQIIA